MKKIHAPRVTVTFFRRVLRAAPVLFVGVLLATMILPLVQHNRAEAYTNFVQNDWSNGVGTDPTNQYSAVENVDATNSLAVGNSANAAWCNTASCDSSWTLRKKILFTNDTGDTFTNETVKVELSFDPGMNNDFSDLRFANTDGDTNIAYWVADKVDGVSATAYLQFSSISPGISTVYAYFGNSIAVSESTISIIDLTDGFSSGSLGPQWNAGAGTINGDTITLNTNYEQLSTPAQYTNGQEGYLEYDLKISGDQYNCNSNSDFGWDGYYNRWRVSLGTGYSCDYGSGVASYYHINNLANVGTNNLIRSTHFNFDTWYRFRTVTRIDPANSSNEISEFYYSNNGGQTFIKLPGVPAYTGYPGSDYILFTGYGASKQFRNIRHYHSAAHVTTSQGLTEEIGSLAGTLDSSAIAMPNKSFFGKAFLASSEGRAGLKVRTATQADMSDAPEFSTCQIIYDNQSLEDSGCMTKGHEYMQYQIIMTTNASGESEVSSITLQYDFDDTAPGAITGLTMKNTAGGFTVSDGGWVQSQPYFSWDAADDNLNGVGLQGYCIYLGTDSAADFTQSQGVFDPTYSPLDSDCQYTVASNYLDPAEADRNLYGYNNPYHFMVAAIDKLGNIGTPATISLRADHEQPEIRTAFAYPTGTIGSKNFNVTWIGAPLGMLYDEYSGASGLKYCLTKVTPETLDNDDYCDDDSPNWYGIDKTKGYLKDTSNVIPFTTGGVSIGPEAADELDDGADGGAFGNGVGFNYISFGVVDQVGNIRGSSDSATGYVFITNNPPSTPRNLQVTPASSSTNNFSFSWSVPQIFSGPPNQVDYCYSINAPIAANASNCTWTGQGSTQLAASAYATQPGLNTLYLMAKDQTGNFSVDNSTSITFTANTAAPGAPTNMDLTDLSTKATSAWKLASTWSAPTQTGSGIAAYRIYRSTDNANFTQVGSTSPANLSYIDSGLSQVTYYYYVRACDSANNCSAPSSVASKKPTGRFTSPANLTSSGQPKTIGIGPKKATITWTTDRDSDSKVAIGTKPGEYAAQEVGNSNQQPDHQVELTNLLPGTTYFYVVKWTDDDGNTGTSTEHSFTTLAAPSVSEVEMSSLTNSSGVLNFITNNATKVVVLYGPNDNYGQSKSINTATKASAYSLKLDDLQPGTRYNYKLYMSDADELVYESNVYSFDTPPRPLITNLRFQPVADAPKSTLQVTWNTNVATDSRISFGQKDIPDSKPTELFDAKTGTEHTLIMTNLLDDKDYTLVASGADALGNVATSDTQAFHTALDTRPPKISELVVESNTRGSGLQARGQIIVSWRTDEPSTSQVAYSQGQASTLNNRTTEDGRLTTEHTVIVSDLATASIYRVQPITKDQAGNAGSSDAQTVIIGRGSDNIFNIVFNALQKIFGVKE